MARAAATERRIVTVLFADLVGFTALSDELDAEDVVTVQDAYFGVVRETVGRYGGRLEKFIGDAAMAVFGVPLARDDDAERAVRAALALTGAVEQLGARLELEPGALRVRVGVNSGEAVVSPDAGPDAAMVTGDTVNVAARFQAAADSGEVVVGETTALAVADAVELETVGAIELKGKAQPVRAWRAAAIRPERSREHAMGALRAPLLGRGTELAELLAAFRGVAPGSGARLVLVAPPGVGKTRLVDELAERVTGEVLRARLRPDVLGPYDAVGQLGLAALGARLGSGFGIDAAAEAVRERLVTSGATSARAAAVVDDFTAVVWPRTGETATRERDLAEGREARFSAWIEALDALADRRPLWLVEDAHWAGPDLLAFLDAATNLPSAHGRLVLATARPSLLESAPGWSTPRDGVTVLELAPLTRTGTAELVRALVGPALPEALVERIAERSDGNPLFVEELLRTWVSVGTLVAADGRWTLAEAAEDVSLPATVQAIYGAQLDDLPPAARAVARRGSVAGRRFPLAALEPLGIEGAGEGVEVLRRRALVSGPHADALAGDSYAYRHALLRDAGYASLARAERALLHARLARWLEESAGARAAQVAELIGRHYAAALDSVPALAREVAPGLTRADAARLAADWFERAASSALEVAAFDAARSLLVRALELTAEDATAEEARRRRKLGELTATSAHMDEGAAEIERALELARSVGDRGEIARAAAALSWVLDQQVQFMPAARVADEALREIGERDDSETALLLTRRATAVANGTDAVDEPRADAERALAISRSIGDAELELEALTLIAGVSLDDDRRGTWERLERLALERSAWPTALDALQTRALILAPDHAAEAVPLAERAVELAEARGLREALAWSHYGCVELGLVSGQWDWAVAAGRRALEIGVANGYDRPVVRTWSAILPIAAARRDTALLEEGARWLIGRFREPENPSPYARIMMAARKLDIASAGLGAPIVPGVEERVVSFALPYGTPSWLAALEAVVESWLAAGELDGVERCLDEMRATEGGAARLRRGTETFLRARLRAARGETGAGEGALGALDDFRACSAPWWIAKALRLRDVVGEASTAERAELAHIEGELGVRRPD